MSDTAEIVSRAKELQVTETPTSSVDRPEAAKKQPLVSMTTMATPQWTFAQMYGQKRLFKSQAVEADQTGNLWKFHHTPANIIELFELQNLKEYFGWYKATPRFTIEIQSSMQHVGLLALSYNPIEGMTDEGKIPLDSPNREFTPNPGSSYDDFIKAFYGFTPSKQFSSQRNIILKPHQLISLGHNSNTVYQMPWKCMRKALPVQIDWLLNNLSPSSNVVEQVFSSLYLYSMGSLSLDIFAPLQVAAGVNPSFTVRTYVELPDLELFAYNPLGFKL